MAQALTDDLWRLLNEAREDLGPNATEDEVQALADDLWRLLNEAHGDLGPNATEDEVQALADERYYGLIHHAEASRIRLYVPKKQNAELRALLDETDELIERAKTREAKRPLRVQAARISGLTLSPLLPPGALRISLMVGLVAGGVLGCVYWSWWFAFAWLTAATFSPRIVGEIAYLAGCFVRGYRRDD